MFETTAAIPEAGVPSCVAPAPGRDVVGTTEGRKETVAGGDAGAVAVDATRGAPGVEPGVAGVGVGSGVSPGTGVSPGVGEADGEGKGLVPVAEATAAGIGDPGGRLDVGWAGVEVSAGGVGVAAADVAVGSGGSIVGGGGAGLVGSRVGMMTGPPVGVTVGMVWFT